MKETRSMSKILSGNHTGALSKWDIDLGGFPKSRASGCFQMRPVRKPGKPDRAREEAKQGCSPRYKSSLSFILWGAKMQI